MKTIRLFGREVPGVAVLGVWAVGVLMAVGLGLVLVRAPRGGELRPPRDWRALEDARVLDLLLSEADGYLVELADAPGVNSGTEQAVWQDHVERDLRPRIAQYRLRVLAEQGSGRSYQALMVAADRLGAAAANAGDDEALQRAREAHDSARTVIQQDIARLAG